MWAIPFPVTIDEGRRDPDLPAKLREELPGVLAWVVRGCLAWQAHGLVAPPGMRTATRAAEPGRESVAAFLAAQCVARPSARVWARDLYG